ncbi:MAG: hypothetical protein HPM95_05280 [Alphaproteobacteria bacterium]|nr:hypothetical protein [Alphaproteobacteria bacterium]
MSSPTQAETAASRSSDDAQTPVLLTPGPLTTSARVKEAMLRDWGSRDPAFVDLSHTVFERIRALAGGTEAAHVCVPLQGSGTFAVEAMLTTFVGAGERVLLLINGAYGHRMADICRKSGRAVEIYEVAETDVHDAAEIAPASRRSGHRFLLRWSIARRPRACSIPLRNRKAACAPKGVGFWSTA